MLRKFGLILIGVVLALLVLQSRTPAQSSANLQADVYQLKFQVSQLQAQINQLSRQGYPAPTNAAPTRVSGSPQLDDRQIVDRLATLAIEAKERLNALEARVTKLEKRMKSG